MYPTLVDGREREGDRVDSPYKVFLDEVKGLDYMTFKLEIDHDLFEGVERQVVFSAGAGQRLRAVIGEPGFFWFGKAPVDAHAIDNVAGGMLMAGTFVATESTPGYVYWDYVGGGVNREIKGMGSTLSFAVPGSGGEFFAMLQGEGPESTIKYMALQEAALSDPTMAEATTRALYQDVVDNYATPVSLKQLFVWKLLLFSPSNFKDASREVLDAVWNVLSPGERSKFLRRNKFKGGGYTYGAGLNGKS